MYVLGAIVVWVTDECDTVFIKLSIWRNERSPEFIKITSLHILNVLEFILFEMFEKYFLKFFSLFVYQ